MGKIWDKSGSLEFNNSGAVAVGAKAYFYSGGTTTPFTVYEDAAEATAHDHPLVADANGRWPSVFIPFVTSYDVKVTTSGGTQLYYYTELPNPDPVEAVADAVDAEELLRTGDCFFRFTNTTLTGCVRLNGRTIGNASSGGTERANADTVDLFTHLYNSLANGQAAVSGGRGANAAADYAANKTITLPDLRAAHPIGLDDMGNTASGQLASPVAFLHGNTTTAGSLAGANTHQLTVAQTPAHTHGSSGAHTHAVGDINEGGHTHDVKYNQGTAQSGSGITVTTNIDSTGAQGNGNAAALTRGASGLNLSISSSGAHTHTSVGNDDFHPQVSRSLLVTWYIKL